MQQISNKGVFATAAKSVMQGHSTTNVKAAKEVEAHMKKNKQLKKRANDFLASEKNLVINKDN